MGLDAGSEMRWSWIGVALNPGTGVLIRDRRGETRTQRRSHMEMETETDMGGMWPQPRDTWSPQKPEEAERSLPCSVRGNRPCPTCPQHPTWTSDISRAGRMVPML